MDLKSAATSLFPPGVPELTRWRLAVFAVCITSLSFAAWALSPYGFARVEEVKRIKSDVDQVQITQVTQAIFDAKESECTSPERSTSRRFFAQHVEKLIRDYRILTGGANPVVPPCRYPQ